MDSPEDALNKLSLNLLDTNISPERLVVFNQIMYEESVDMTKRIVSRLTDAGFTTDEIATLINNIMGTVAENPGVFDVRSEEI